MWESYIFPFFAVIVLIVYLHYAAQYKRFEARFRKQAAMRNGKVTSKRMALWKIPRLYLYHEGNEISFSPLHRKGGTTSSGERYLYAECFIRNARDYSISITPEYALKKLGSIFGMQDIQLNNHDFDKAFYVSGDNETLVRNLLTPEIQKRLLDASSLELGIHIENKEFECSVYKPMTEDNQLDLFIDVVIAVVGRAHQLS